MLENLCRQNDWHFSLSTVATIDREIKSEVADKIYYTNMIYYVCILIK